MSFIFTILTYLGFLASPYQSDVKHQDPLKFDPGYTNTVRSGIEWELSQ